MLDPDLNTEIEENRLRLEAAKEEFFYRSKEVLDIRCEGTKIKVPPIQK